MLLLAEPFGVVVGAENAARNMLADANTNAAAITLLMPATFNGQPFRAKYVPQRDGRRSAALQRQQTATYDMLL